MFKVYKAVIEVSAENALALANHLWHFHNVFNTVYFLVNSTEVNIFEGYAPEKILLTDHSNSFEVAIESETDEEFQMLRDILYYSIPQKLPVFQNLPLKFHFVSTKKTNDR